MDIHLILLHKEKLHDKPVSDYVITGRSRKISDGFILVEVLYILVYVFCRHDADLKASRASKCKPVQGSPCWMAPELLETGDITTKADVYSFAIVLWEMLTRKQPFENCSVYQVCRIIIYLQSLKIQNGYKIIYLCLLNCFFEFKGKNIIKRQKHSCMM